MRLLSPLLLSLALLARAQDFDAPGVQKEKHNYQSDVARLRKIVINRSAQHRPFWAWRLLTESQSLLAQVGGVGTLGEVV